MNLPRRDEQFGTVRKTTTITFEIDESQPADDRLGFVVINMGGNIGAGGLDPVKDRVEMFDRHADKAVTTLELSDQAHRYEHVVIASDCHSDQLQEHHLSAMIEILSDADASKVLVLIGTRKMIDVLARIHADAGLMAAFHRKGLRACLVGSLSPIGVEEGDAKPALGAAFAYLQMAGPGEVFMCVNLKRFDHGKVRQDKESGHFFVVE